MSDRPTPEDFQDALDEYWHDRPPASLEDVMTLYGVMAVAESDGKLYKTPSELTPYIGEGRLITVFLDISEDGAEVVDVKQDTVREEHVEKLAYAHKTSGQGSKYSITQTGSADGNKVDTIVDTRYGTLGKLAGWATQDSIQKFIDEGEHPDTWILEKIQSVLGKKSDSLEEVANSIEELLPADESIPTVLTVRIQADASNLDSEDGVEKQWLWPGEINVLTEAMERYATANASDKNIKSGPPSVGYGKGYVSGNNDRVVGTPESPLEVFSVKHPDAQPGLRKEESWRNYPISDDVAMLFAKARNLIDRCVYRNGGMETYALPYFAGKMTGMKADALHLAIDSVDPDRQIGESTDPPMAQVTYNLLVNDDPEKRKLAEQELRFYTVTMPISDDKNIIAEEPAASVYWPNKLADALRETVEGPTLDPATGGFTPVDNWPLLSWDSPDKKSARWRAYALVTNHQFTDAVFGYRDEEGDDFRRIVDHRLLSGTPVEARTLFKEYLQRYGDESEDGDPPPQQIVAQQLVHLETLSRAGLLTGIDTPIELTKTTMTTETIDTSDIATIREQRLESFLNRPLFDEPTRKAATLAGVLVGQISWHQDNIRDVGRPLDSGTKGDQLTKNGLENALTAALEKAKVYAQDSEKSYHRDLLFPETVDRLLEETDSMPTGWDIDKSELQFCYVLGHAHGRRSMPVAYQLRAEDRTDSTETAAAESTTN
ncbi:type I-B CRISPR-associated protein Cas8b/Csh1 [Halodesulfurarchaeum formicicum]|uniref:CRISPR-associated protein Cas8b/Csh1 n=1 Tax=Halodesulfurarchaeum formicicum TaxID=1873524 RepID=A0A1J1AD49_9EURY|nr:type I-B CRISPR-associated protein Cas8b/Csh1 [Halodesulfurarchaeum formicicum]APE95699.1 CRISPR-associated protein Cas8b/Csh1 [Halodesulfurarchaeum formicicum]